MRLTIICPHCGKPGFLAWKWVRSSYYPKYASLIVMRLEEELLKLKENPTDPAQQKYVQWFRDRVRGEKYREKTWDKYRVGANNQPTPLDGNIVYRVSSSKYKYLYVGHYDADKYQKEKADFKAGKRKSKPSGRRWCYLR
jgi:hypothetical protein